MCIARCAFRFFAFTFIYIQSASKMVNSRMHSLTFTRIFYSKSSLVSTHFAQITREKFNMNPGEKQAEIYTYEAPWLIYACNWSVRLRFFCLICARSASRVALFLSLSLSVHVRWNSNREPLFILFGMGSKLYPRCCVLYAVRVGAFARISTDTNKCSSFLPLFRAINAR